MMREPVIATVVPFSLLIDHISVLDLVTLHIVYVAGVTRRSNHFHSSEYFWVNFRRWPVRRPSEPLRPEVGSMNPNRTRS